MAFGRLERSAPSRPMGEINMTPLIDVMLVLLVIFIITAPLMSTSLKLELPKSAAARPSDAPQFVSVAVQPDGTLYWGDEKVTAEALTAKVKAAAARHPGTEVQLRADQSVPYGRVAELIGLVQQGGLTRIGFVAIAPADAAPR